MHIRVVRFSNVSRDHIDQLVARINDSDGPPPGVTMSGMKLVYDAGQNTALSIQEYATAEDMAQAAKVFDAMDSSETPGSRTSVDEGEVALEFQP
jgi:hypothetical protein